MRKSSPSTRSDRAAPLTADDMRRLTNMLRRARRTVERQMAEEKAQQAEQAGVTVAVSGKQNDQRERAEQGRETPTPPGQAGGVD